MPRDSRPLDANPEDFGHLTPERVDEIVRQKIAAYDHEVRNRQKYTLHADLHLPGNRDPLNLTGANTDGPGSLGGLWPQMKDNQDVSITSGTITLTNGQDQYTLACGGAVSSQSATHIGLITDGEDFWRYNIATTVWTQTADNITGTTGTGALELLRSWQYGSTTVLFAVFRHAASIRSPGDLYRSPDGGTTWEVALPYVVDATVSNYGVVDYDIAPNGDVFALYAAYDTAAVDNSQDTFPMRVYRSKAADMGAPATFDVVFEDVGYDNVSPAHTNLANRGIMLAVTSDGDHILIVTSLEASDSSQTFRGVRAGDDTWTFTGHTGDLPSPSFAARFDQIHRVGSNRIIYADYSSSDLYVTDDYGDTVTLLLNRTGLGPVTLGWWKESWGATCFAQIDTELMGSQNNGDSWSVIDTSAVFSDTAGLDYSPQRDQVFHTTTQDDEHYIIDTPFGTPAVTAIPNTPATDSTNQALTFGAYIGEISATEAAQECILNTILHYPDNRFAVLRSSYGASASSNPITITEDGNITILNPTQDATYGDVIILDDQSQWVLAWYEPDQGRWLAYLMDQTNTGSLALPDYWVDAAFTGTAGTSIITASGHTVILYSTIQGAVTAADALSTNDDSTIFICPGIYNEKVTISRPNNAALNIVGSGQGNTIIQPASPLSGTAVSLGTITSDECIIEISGLTIDTTLISGAGTAVSNGNPVRARMRNCRIVGVSGDIGVNASSTAYALHSLDDVIFSGSITCIQVGNGGSILARGCSFESGTTTGISIIHEADCQIEDCSFSSATGISFATFGRAVQITGNKFLGCTDGIKTQSSLGGLEITSSITGNMFEDCADAIDLASVGGDISGLGITGNNFYRITGSVGIRLHSTRVKHSVITSNTFIGYTANNEIVGMTQAQATTANTQIAHNTTDSGATLPDTHGSLGASQPWRIIDADGDTYVRTESAYAADEDIIQMQYGPTPTIAARLGALGLQLGNATDFKMYTTASGGFSSIVADWDGATGHFQINDQGGAAATAEIIFAAAGSVTDPASGVVGVQANPTLVMTTNNAQTLRAFNTSASVSGAFTLSGIVTVVLAGITAATSGQTVNDIRNFAATNTIAAGATVVDRYGIRILNATGSGSLTNQYGVYIENMAKGGTLNRAIQSLGGISTHLGAFSIGHNVAPASTAILDLATAVTGVGLRIPSQTTANAPSSSNNGTLWYDSTTDRLRAREAALDRNVINWPYGETPTAVTIATGAFTVTAGKYMYTIETEAAAASDDLDTISGLETNRLYTFKPVSDARSVVFKHETGNLHIAHKNADLTLDDIEDFVLLWYDGTTAMVLGGSGSGAGASDAADLTYTPGTTTDWSDADPGDTDNALDVLADRTSYGREVIHGSRFIGPIAKTSPAAPPEVIDSGAQDIHHRGVPFLNSGTTYAQAEFKLPNNYKDATHVYVRITWFATSGSGDMKWNVAMVAGSHDDAIDTAYGSIGTSPDGTVTNTLTATGDYQESSEIDVTIANSPVKNDTIQIEVSRISTDGADTLSGTAYLKFLEVIWRSHTTGYR